MNRSGIETELSDGPGGVAGRPGDPGRWVGRAAGGLGVLLCALVPLEPWLDAAPGGATWLRYVGGAAVLLTGASALLDRDRGSLPAGVAGLGAFVAWALVSGAWATDREAFVHAAGVLARLFPLFVAASWLLGRAWVRTGAAGGYAFGAAVLVGLVMVEWLDVRALPDPLQPHRFAAGGGDANDQARLVAVGLVLGAASAARRWSPRAARVLASAAFAAGPALWILGSRGALLSLAAGLGALAATGSAPARRAVAVAALSTALGAAAGGGMGIYTPRVAERAALGGDPDLNRATSGRDAITRIGLEMSRRALPLGVGLGGFPGRYDPIRADLRLEGETQPRRDAHSIYLQALAETGPAGLVMLLAGLFGIGCALVRAPASPDRAAGLAVLAFTCVSAGLTPQLDRKLFWLGLAGAAGCAVSHRERERTGQREGQRGASTDPSPAVTTNTAQRFR